MFPATTVEMFLDVQVQGGTAYVTFGDLRPLLPDAPTVCGSEVLRATLDRTLLALDGIDTTRYALADQALFSEWLQVIDPDEPWPEPADAEAGVDDGAAVDLDAGWTSIADFTWPVAPACCSLATTGPASPEGELTPERWPTDGFYDAEVVRRAGTLGDLTVTLRRWVACTDRPDLPCGDLPDGLNEDIRIVGDPASEVVRTVAVDDIGVVLVPLHGPVDSVWPAPSTAMAGEPGGLARLLTAGLDPAYRTWVLGPHLAGGPWPTIRDDLVERSIDPAFPFGIDICEEAEDCGAPVGYRGPLDTNLIVVPAAISAPLDRWPAGHNGLYGWQNVTLEIRDGAPILYLWAGQVAG